MENIISALQVNVMLLGLIFALTFTVLGVIARSEDGAKLLEARIENGFFAVSGLILFLIFFLM